VDLRQVLVEAYVSPILVERYDVPECLNAPTENCRGVGSIKRFLDREWRPEVFCGLKHGR